MNIVIFIHSCFDQKLYDLLFFCRTQKKQISKNAGSQTILVAIGFHCIEEKPINTCS